MANLTVLPNRLRVLAADSTSMSTQLLAEALARDPQFQMIESPSSVAAILPVLRREKPHVAVVSAKLGESSRGSFDLVREIRAQVPGTRVVVLLDSSDRSAVVEAFRAGAQGVFCRTEPFRLLAKCIQCVHSGQIWANSGELQFVLEALGQPAFASLRAHSGSLLTAREIDVVRCVAEGLSNREIAHRLKLTEHTVKNYLFRIFDKLGVSSRVEVVLYALGNGTGHQDASATPRRAQSQSISVGKPQTSPVAIRKTAM
jgi:two-component system, NarL family, nitrate/nitrite response regulator NarL